MSTDDSISEDVSSSVALSTDHHVPHHHHHHHGDRSKDSEASIVSSEDTASGPVERPTEGERPVQTLEGFLQAAEETNRSRAAGSLPHRIR